MEGCAVPLLRLVWIALLMLLLVGCQTATPEPPPDPLDLITEASANIRETEAFKMIVEQTGAPYFIETDLGRVLFRRAEAQYAAPGEMQAEVRLRTPIGLTAVVDIFSRGEEQWYRNDILTGDRWYNAPYSPGFNPETLIAEESGFQAALAALIDMEYIGEVTLESGAPAYHLHSTAEGPQVTALLAELIVLPGEVTVDVYIHRETGLPVRFVIIDPNSITDEEPDPTTWTIDVYDFDGEVALEDPEADPNTIPYTDPLILTPEGAGATTETTESENN
jgi:hypothetical protein